MTTAKKKIAILGSTGSIGRNTLDVVSRNGSRFEILGLAAGSNLTLLAEQIDRYQPRIVSVRSGRDAQKLKTILGNRRIEIVSGPEGAERVAADPDADIVVSAITGIDGLRPTLAAVRAGRCIALANKESLVAAGALLIKEAARSGARFIPVDSEHSGVFQCLSGVNRNDVSRVVLTASGGPFFRTPLAEIGSKTVEEALAHPRWKMGKKVTVDSATMMNKGLELIEARWLFDLPPARLGILIHPQSLVHSLVEMRDGSVLAQLGPADMRLPIQYALTHPLRADSDWPRLDLSRVRTLEFFEVDEARFPLVRLARRVLEEERSRPVALNAANEAAVSAFLEHRIGFGMIAGIVSEVVETHLAEEAKTLDEILEIDRTVRRRTEEIIKQRI